MAKKKHSEEQGVIESPEALAEQISKTEAFIQKNQVMVYSIVGVIAAIIVGFFTYRYYMENQNSLAQTELIQAVYYFEADSLDKALNGDGNNLGFLDIISDYGGTKAGNLSSFYAGASYLKKGEFEESIEYLQQFNSSDLVIQSRSYSLIGDAYMEMGNYFDAIEFYNKAANNKPNKFFSPDYLLKAAIAYEKVKDYEGALRCYQEIVEKYHDSKLVQHAKKHKARLEGLSS